MGASTYEVRKMSKKHYAEEIFEKMYPNADADKIKVLEEVKDQIEVCEDMCRPVTKEMIKEWLMLKNAIQVERKAKAYRFAA